VPSEGCSIEEQSIEYCGWACCVNDVWRAHNVTIQNTLIHSILLSVPQFSISQKALGMLPKVGNVMPKHVGTTKNN
jgi:hypothetical protein